MGSRYTLKDARRYATDVQGLARPQDFDLSGAAAALKVLAEAGDEEGFRMVVDSYERCCSATDEKDRTELAKEPLAVMEWLCMNMDHGFTGVGCHAWAVSGGTKRDRLPALQVQQFFNRLYGGHFYLD